LYQVFRGLVTVGKHTFREPITLNFPDKAPDLPAHFRGRLALTVNPETGEHLCISCRQCERVCPDKCIEITAHKSPPTNKLELIDFKIDHGLCMFCGLCTEVCPTLCIINTKDFEMADYTRSSLVYDLKRLTLTQEESAYYFEQKDMPLPKPKPAKAPAAAAAAKPAEGEAAKPAAPAKSAEGEAAKPAAPAKSAEGEAAKATEGEVAKPPAAAKPAAGESPKPAAPAKAAGGEASKANEAKSDTTKPAPDKAKEETSESKPKETKSDKEDKA
jgi:NADH-quinone oxidoreductase subunit I